MEVFNILPQYINRRINVMNIIYSVEGEFITQLARTKCYEEHRAKYAIDLLKSVTMTDDLTESEHLALCMDILSGKKEIVGTYPNSDYRIKTNEGITDNKFIEYIDDVSRENATLKEQLKKATEKMDFLLNYLSLDDDKKKEINREFRNTFGEELFEIESNLMPPLLSSFLERMNDTEEHSTEDYGWLEPNGTFHPVDYGEHWEWAHKYAEENFPFAEYPHMYKVPTADGGTKRIEGSDFLIYALHWVLLDNPAQGIASVTRDESRALTKAQKEFLYNYYRERNLTALANKIWNE
jgi:hypothetical protein